MKRAIMWILLIPIILIVNIPSPSTVEGDHSSIHAHVARNVIVGQKIKVCSEYPNATTKAISIWNSALHTAGYTTEIAFELHLPESENDPELSPCKLPKDVLGIYQFPDDTLNMITHVIIAAVPLGGKSDEGVAGYPICPVWDGAVGCTGVLPWNGEPYYPVQQKGNQYWTFQNEVVISIMTEMPVRKDDPSTTKDESKEPWPRFPISTDETSDPLHPGLVALIAHELGHALGLAHPGDAVSANAGIETPSTSSPPCVSLMGSIYIGPCPFMTFTRDPVTHAVNSFTGTTRVTGIDRAAWSKAYEPDPVLPDADRPSEVDGTAAKSIIKEVTSSGTVTFAWNDGNIHVAKYLEIQRYTNSGWAFVRGKLNGKGATIDGRIDPVDGGKGSKTFVVESQPGGWQRYRIVSVTDAWTSTPSGSSRSYPMISARVCVPGRSCPTANPSPSPTGPSPTPVTCSLTGNASAGGSVGSASGTCGTTLSVTATANPGYYVASWTGCTDSPATGAGTTTSTCSRTVAASAPSQSVSVRFARNQCTLSASAGAGGKVTSRTGNCGSSLGVTATADAGYHVSGWRGCPGAPTGSRTSTCTLTISTSQSVSVTFALNQCSLTATAGTGGTVNPTSWSGGCGTSVDLTATPSAGYHVSGWSGGGCSGTGTSCNVKVGGTGGSTSPVSVSVSFARNQCSLTVTAGTGGTVSPTSWSGNCGTEVPLTASPNSPGYGFGSWTGCSSTAKTCTVTVGSDGGSATSVSVSASFSARYCRLRFVVGNGAGSFTTTAGGTTRAGSERSVQCGQPISYAARAGTGYCFSRWGGASLGASGQAGCRSSSGTQRIASLTADFTFTAHFTKQRHTLTVTSSAQPRSAGSVSPGPGTHTYDHGTRVTLRASGLFGSVWLWGGACSGSRTTCTVVMNGPRSVSVTFSPGGSGGFGEDEEASDGPSGQAETPTPSATVTPTPAATPAP